MKITNNFFADEKREGFRAAAQREPVLYETWMLCLSSDHRELSFEAEIIPTNGKSTVSISLLIGRTHSKPSYYVCSVHIINFYHLFILIVT